MQWRLVSESFHAWGEEGGVVPTDLGVRITYLAPSPITEDRVPDGDIAVPFARDLGPRAANVRAS